MLHLAYLGEAKKMDFVDGAKRILAVRKPVSGIPNGFAHVPQLSPSLKLFDKAQIWKKKIYMKENVVYLRNLGIDENRDDAWWFLYKDGFNKELVSRPDMVKAIERLCLQLDDGEEIYLFCYCKNVDHCHRGLVGVHVESLGYPVDFRRIVTASVPTIEQPECEQLCLFSN